MKALSKSRNVNGYVKAVRARDALASKRVDAELTHEERVRPLQAKLDAARVDVRERYGNLTGGQLAEAERMLRAEVSS